MQAAGGLVLNEKKEILLIFRRGKWDMPKGKLDKGEKLEDCAIREVGEVIALVDENAHRHPCDTPNAPRRSDDLGG